MQIKRTKNYKKFKTYQFNRPVDKNHVKRLVESFEKHGILKPIQVSRNFEIIDGQHTFEALKILGEEIPFIVIDKSDDELPGILGALNSTAKRWSQEDWLNLWVSKGKQDYVWLKEIWEKHGVHLPIVISFLPGKSKEASSRFKNGEMVIKKTMKKSIEKRLMQIRGIKSHFKDIPKIFDAVSFQYASAAIIRANGYDHIRMMDALSKRKGMVQPSPLRSDYIRSLLDVYNHWKKEKLEIGTAK